MINIHEQTLLTNPTDFTIYLYNTWLKLNIILQSDPIFEF